MAITIAMILAAQRAYTHATGERLDTYAMQAVLKAAWEAEQIRLVETGLTREDPEEMED